MSNQMLFRLTIADDKVYPKAWDNPIISASHLFDTSEECCSTKFSGLDCSVVNVCGKQQEEASAGCAVGWHPSLDEEFTCTNSDNFIAMWPPTMFFDTGEGCCDEFFNGPCNIVADCSSPIEVATTTTTKPTTVVISQALLLDWESETIDDNLVKFEGIGKWSIDDSQPCCRDGVAIHSPRLIPGEYSTMVIEYSAPSGGSRLSFDHNVGLGTFTFFIDGKEKLKVAVPGGGTNTFKGDLEPGDHKLSWRFDAPVMANLPLSMVWIDNIEISN